MSNKPDYYTVLGVNRGSDPASIKKAYRNLALKYHPDRNPNDKEAEERFKEAAEAYEVLSDPEKKQLYDQYGHEGLHRTGFEGFKGFGDIFSSFGDIFGDFFGSSRPGPRKGRDLHLEVVIEFQDAYNGCDPKIKIPRAEKCTACDGTGSKSRIIQRCPKCHGEGQVVQTVAFLRMASTCPQCRGTGEYPSDPCPECGGQGMVMREKELTFHVPAGIDTGARIRLRGEGGVGELGGQPGDLYVDISVKHHDLFSRERNHVIYETKIDMVLACLGGELEVPTVGGEFRTIRIPEGAQNGKFIKVPGMGFPTVNSGSNYRGDQIVVLAVVTPNDLTDRQRELLEEFGAIEEEKKSVSTLKGWTRKITNKVKKVLQN
jgi:molecular chaperone DnaJ